MQHKQRIVRGRRRPACSRISAVVNVGMALGSVYWGSFADVHGRRRAFLLSVGLTAVLGAISALAHDLSSYCALQFATGFAIGGNLPLAVAAVSELLPPSYRDRALVALHLFYEIGALSSTGLAAWLMPRSCEGGSRCDWRPYIVSVSLPATVAFIVAYWRLPESPFWLAIHGHEADMHVVLARARGGRRFELLNDGAKDGAPAAEAGQQGGESNPDDAADLEHLNGGRERLQHLLTSRSIRATTLSMLMLWLFENQEYLLLVWHFRCRLSCQHVLMWITCGGQS